MTYTLVANNKQIDTLIIKYQNYKVIDNNNYTLFRGKIKSSTLTIFSTNKILIQGNNCYELYQEICDLLNITVKQNNLKKELDSINVGQTIIGTDEVGTGDYFGGIVVCACCVPCNKILELTRLGIKDSKKIDDKKIMILGKKLIESIDHAVLLLNNEKYNKIIANSDINLNKIKAILHNKVINSFISKYPNTKYDHIIIDGFCSKEKYLDYLKTKKDVIKNVELETDGESKYISIAAASIIDRYYFLKHLQELSNKYGYDLLKGASSKVDLLIKKIVKEKGIDYLYNFAKVNFKNTMKGIGMKDENN